jgi:hypothetical protein
MIVCISRKGHQQKRSRGRLDVAGAKDGGGQDDDDRQSLHRGPQRFHLHGPLGLKVGERDGAWEVQIALVGQTAWVRGRADGGECAGVDEAFDPGGGRGCEDIAHTGHAVAHRLPGVAGAVGVVASRVKDERTVAHGRHQRGRVNQVTGHPLDVQVADSAGGVGAAAQAAHLPAPGERGAGDLPADKAGGAEDTTAE